MQVAVTQRCVFVYGNLRIAVGRTHAFFILAGKTDGYYFGRT